MKHFKFMKGMFACLLTLALVVACFGLTSAKADDKYVVTLNANGGTGDEKTVDVTKVEETEYTLLTSLPTGWEAPENKVFDGWAETANGEKISTGKITLTANKTLYAKYKDAPKVTFTVNTVYGTGDSATTAYTYSKFLYKANDTVTLEEIFGEAKSSSGETIEDSAAWKVNGDPTITVPAGKGAISYSKNTFKVTTALTADATAVINLAPAKINISFTVTEGGKTYKSTFSVDNGAKAKTKISYYDIAAGLKRTESGEDIALEGKVVTKVGDINQSGKYSASAYEVDNKDTIKTADFDNVAIEVADAFTPNSGYDPDTDSIIFESPVEVSVYWVDVKKNGGNTFQSKSFKTIDLKKANNDATTYTGSLPLNDKNSGVKIAENKTAYIYASINAPAEGKNKYAANFIVDATPYKKIAITFAYAQAEKNGTDLAIATVTTVDTNKKTIVYSGVTNEETNPNGLDQIIDVLQYSTDGTIWYGVNQGEVQVGGKTVNVNFDLNKLYEYVNSGSKTSLSFRIKGKTAEPEIPADSEEEEGTPAKNANRACKPVKISIAGAKDAKAVKVNYANGTLALKNGYDYFVTDNAKAVPSVSGAITILPYNKDGKATAGEGDEAVATYEIDTADFVPVKKAAENDKMFTSIKVKSILISDIVDDTSKDMYIWVRKSASANKPAEKWVCIKLGKVTDAPVITKTKAGYFSAQDPADTKGVIAAPEIKNASSDKNSGAYEYLIVDAADMEGTEAKIDFTNAKWNTIGAKGLTIGKSSSKYAKEVGKSASAHILKEGSVVLVRRAGDKGSSALASNYLPTTIAKAEVEVEVEKDGKTTKEKKELFVWTSYTPAAAE